MKLRTLLLTAVLALPATGHASQDVFCEHVSGIMGGIYRMQDQGFALRDTQMFVRTQCQLRQDLCDTLLEVARMAHENPVQHWGAVDPGEFVREKVQRECIVKRIEAGAYGSGLGF